MQFVFCIPHFMSGIVPQSIAMCCVVMCNENDPEKFVTTQCHILLQFLTAHDHITHASRLGAVDAKIATVQT